MESNHDIRGVWTRRIGTGFYGTTMIDLNELRILRQRVRLLSQRLEQIKKRVETPETKPGAGVAAIVDKEECTGCGICYDVCPSRAISIDRTAKIDSSRCTACLECVNRCPTGAIAVKYQHG